MREHSLLDVLSRQHDGEGGHLQMKQVADAVSQPERHHPAGHPPGGPRAASRNLRLTDRRGIYTNMTEAGLQLLKEARPTNEKALREALDEAARNRGLRRSSRQLRRSTHPPDTEGALRRGRLHRGPREHRAAGAFTCPDTCSQGCRHGYPPQRLTRARIYIRVCNYCRRL